MMRDWVCVCVCVYASYECQSMNLKLKFSLVQFYNSKHMLIIVTLKTNSMIKDSN